MKFLLDSFEITIHFPGAGFKREAGLWEPEWELGGRDMKDTARPMAATKLNAEDAEGAEERREERDFLDCIYNRQQCNSLPRQVLS